MTLPLVALWHYLVMQPCVAAFQCGLETFPSLATSLTSLWFVPGSVCERRVILPLCWKQPCLETICLGGATVWLLEVSWFISKVKTFSDSQRKHLGSYWMTWSVLLQYFLLLWIMSRHGIHLGYVEVVVKEKCRFLFQVWRHFIGNPPNEGQKVWHLPSTGSSLACNP